MDTVKVIQVVETTLARRGAGKDQSDPIRIITQYWSLDGKLLAEVDPFPVNPAPVPEDYVDAHIIDKLGPLAREALHRHPRKFWALEEIRSYARFLQPRRLEDGDDAELARLIDKGRAP